MFDTEGDNFTTNVSSNTNYSDSYGRKEFPLIQLYLDLPLRLTMSLAIVISAGIVLWAIKKSKRTTTTLHFFFIANLMIADISVAVIHNGTIIVDTIVKTANPMSEGADCNIIRISTFSITANTIMLTALCFDRLYSIIVPHHYRRNMNKRRGCVIVLAIWIVSLLLSLLSFLDPHVHSKKAVICGTSLYKSFGLVVVTIPLFLSAVFVVIQNIYLYCVVVKTTSRSGNNGNTMAAGMWRTLKETKKASIILLILSGTSIFFGIIQQVTLAVIQSQVAYSMGKVIVYSLVMPFIYNFNILLHSLLYGYFLHSIRESLGICRCFCALSE